MSAVISNLSFSDWEMLLWFSENIPVTMTTFDCRPFAPWIVISCTAFPGGSAVEGR